jgi:hypothetical protein
VPSSRLAVILILSWVGLASSCSKATDSTPSRDRSVVLRGKGSPPVATGEPGEPGYFPAAEKRYWADPGTGSIRRADPDGSDAEVLVSGLNAPYGLCYDQVTQELIWTSSEDEKVQVLRLGSSSPAFLETSFDDEPGLATSGGDRQVAYVAMDGDVLELSQQLDSETEQRRVLAHLQDPRTMRGLALSSDGRALYLGDTVGRMAQKLTIATRKLEPLTFIDEVPPPSPEALEDHP